MSAYFAEEMMRRSGKCLTILSNGGAQRGHTVVRDVRHVFRHFGSGTFAGADTYFPAEFIVNPMIFMKEYRHPSAGGVHVKYKSFSETGRGCVILRKK